MLSSLRACRAPTEGVVHGASKQGEPLTEGESRAGSVEKPTPCREHTVELATTTHRIVPAFSRRFIRLLALALRVRVRWQVRWCASSFATRLGTRRTIWATMQIWLSPTPFELESYSIASIKPATATSFAGSCVGRTLPGAPVGTHNDLETSVPLKRYDSAVGEGCGSWIRTRWRRCRAGFRRRRTA
jgi:hypothetical protein